LDALQERACVNTLFLDVFTHSRDIVGRKIPRQPLPDLGKQEYDLNFHGGTSLRLIRLNSSRVMRQLRRSFEVLAIV
jgi:hypothetical protein